MRIVHIKTFKGGTLFFIQYISLVYLIFSGSLYPSEWYTWIPYLAGWVLGLWAIIAMGSGNVNAGPDIIAGSPPRQLRVHINLSVIRCMLQFSWSLLH